MKLTKSEREVFDEFMENPFYREVVESAPSEACRDYIIRGLIYGLYGGYSKTDKQNLQKHKRMMK